MTTDLPTNLIPLIDGDWICYMACQAIEYNWKGPEDGTPPFHDILTVFENRIKEIKGVLQTTAAPIIFFTGTNNFREGIAKAKKYKGNRDKEKPFHYQNLKNVIEVRYDTRVDDELEADDLMSMYQTEVEGYNYNPVVKTCIVTVDKDLRQVNGWHYSPEGYNYPSFGPVYVTDENTYVEVKSNKTSKLIGTGWKFFYGQLLTGDTVDNIPGLPGTGPSGAVKILGNTTTRGEAFEAVREAYRDVCWDPDAYLLEQARLLWMVRERDKAGKPVMWTPPEVNND